MIWSGLCARLGADRDRPAIIWDGGSLNCGTLLARVTEKAVHLPAAKPNAPTRVLLTTAPPLEFLVNILACWSQGLVPVLLREGRGAESVLDVYNFLSPAAVMEAADVKLSEPQTGHTEARRELGPRDEALVICTSGTTVVPKLVALPAEAVTVNAAEIGARLGFQPGDLVAIPTPLTYMYGLMGGAISALWAGAAIRMFSPASPPSQIQAAIRNEGITVLQGPPSFLRLFLAYWNGIPFDGVRLVTSGGEQIGRELVARIGTAFPSCRMEYLYGMTEAGPRISHRRVDVSNFEEGLIGKPFEHFSWRVDPVEGVKLPSGAGRLMLRGPTVFLGYVTRNGDYEGLDADGFFGSNDLVREDSMGNLHYLERIDSQFKSGGKLVSIAEIETVLLGHATVAEARCIKEAHPILGFVPVAEVVARAGAHCDLDDLRNHCRAFLQNHAVPRRFEIRCSFDLAPSGKRLISI